jgi:two-component SAPR family response regulator
MKNLISAFVTLTVLLALVFTSEGRTNEESYFKLYDETIFVISNYSGVDATVKEKRSVQDLLDQNIGGFRFSLEWERQGNQLMLKNPDNTSSPFIETMATIKKTLDAKPDKILTLFLDFNVNVGELTAVFQDAGIIPYLYVHTPGDDWPSLKNMVETNKRLVVFSMQDHRNSPDWLHYVWDNAVEPYFSLLDAPVFKGEFLKGDPKNSLLIYNDYNSPSGNENENNQRFDSAQNPYLIEHFKTTWMNAGKTPNFIMLDQYGSWILGVLTYLRSFKTIRGTVTYNTGLLDYVNWEGIGSLTSGKFCFPIGPGDNLTLIPRSPGYRFTPESVTFEEPSQNKIQHFVASALEITEGLESHYRFDKNAKDYTINGLNGTPENVEFKNDSVRGMVAFFRKGSQIILPKAEAFKVRDHDFTVAAWFKIPEYLPNKQDYCIIGTKNNSYQQGIHLLIRDRQPYFGFYNNDLRGKTIIEAGQWYHIVWRYNKLSGEQAIFVNGKLDSRSLGHPAYKGRDNLYVGVAGFNWSTYMYGSIDDLSIWSRALGEEEIWGMSKQVIDIVPERNIFKRYPVFSVIFLLFLLSISLSYVYWRYLRNILHQPQKLSAEKIKAFDKTTKEKPTQNYIQLFGDFKVLDRFGNDITTQFTPKLKQLFLLILLYSQRSKNGISTKELTDILWEGYSYQNAKNIRGVTIRKLRLLLETIDSVEIVFHIDRWSMKFSGPVYCDYVECLKMLDKRTSHDENFYPEFYQIIREGEVFKGESYDWLDDFKGYIGNNIVDILLTFVQKLSIATDSELILKLTERILIADPVNEIALAFKLKALIRQNNYNLARFTYEKFCSLYEEMYGEKFHEPFDGLIT